MKPESGGRPPSDSKIRGVRVMITGVLAQEVARALMVVEEEELKIRKVEKVIRM